MLFFLGGGVAAREKELLEEKINAFIYLLLSLFLIIPWSSEFRVWWLQNGINKKLIEFE